jgi:hypothetical protein
MKLGLGSMPEGAVAQDPIATKRQIDVDANRIGEPTKWIDSLLGSNLEQCHSCGERGGCDCNAKDACEPDDGEDEDEDDRPGRNAIK